MDGKENEREAFAVACSLSKLPRGRIRLVLDDLRSLAPENKGLWRHDVFVTSKEYEQAQLAVLDIPEEELAAFGYMVLARLLAANKVLEVPQE